MPTFGDVFYSFRNFWTLRRTAAKAAPGRLSNPVTLDYPPAGRYHNWHRWDDYRRAQLSLQTSWSYAAIQRIGLAALSSQLLIKRRRGEETQDIQNHPIELLCQSPNLDTSREYLWLHTYYSIYLSASYWFLYPDAQGNIAEIWPMPFTRVRPIPNESSNPDRLFGGFAYTFQSGKEITLPIDNVIYLRFPDPLDPYGALPPTRAIMRPVVLDNAQAEWNTALFDENKGLPASVVSVPADLDKDQFAQVKRDLAGNVGRRMVTRAGAISVEFMQETHQEMEFLEGRRFNQAEIFDTLGVPLNVSDKEAWRWFVNNTVWPVLTMLAGQISTQLTRPFFGGDIFAEFEDIRPQDRSLEVQEATQYWPSYSLNETRKARGMRPLKPLRIETDIEGLKGLDIWDDVPLRALDTLLPVLVKGEPEPVPEQLQGFAGVPSMPGSAGADHAQQQEEAQAADTQDVTEETEAEAPEATVKALVAWRDIAVKRVKAGKATHVYFTESIPEALSYELATILGLCRSEAEVKAVFAHLDEYSNVKAQLGTPVDTIPQAQLDQEAECTGPIQEWLNEQSTRISRNTGPNSEPPPSSFWDNEVVLLTAFLTPFVGRWAEAGIAETITRLNSTGLGVDALANAHAAEWANTHALELAKGLTETTRELAKAKIKQWLAAGPRDLPALEGSLAEIISPQWRASLIAQTEVTRTMSAARQAIAKELGIVKRMAWVTLEAACPICSELHGKTRSLDGTYPGGYDAPPAHPRCRCAEDLVV